MSFALHTGSGGASSFVRWEGNDKATLIDLCLLPSCTKAATVLKRQENKLASQQPVFRSKFETRTSKTEVRNTTL